MDWKNWCSFIFGQKHLGQYHDSDRWYRHWSIIQFNHLWYVRRNATHVSTVLSHNPICKGKKSIHHISSNICKNKVLHLDVLPFAAVYSFNDTDDQLDTLNKLILSIIDKHAPFLKTIFSRPSAPWIKDIKINKLQHEQDYWRHEVHKNPIDKKCATYRESRNKIKKAIKEKKTQFYRKVLSSKNSKEIWKVIHRIFNPSMSTLQADPSTLNEFF